MGDQSSELKGRGAILRVLTTAGLIALGIAIGFVGTLVGAGGGFLLMPVLAIMYPGERPEALASISLAVVCVNATSGSIGYAFQRKIDYRSGALFILAGLPGAVAGTLVTPLVPRHIFDSWLGGLLLVVAVLMLTLGALRPSAKHSGDIRTPVRHAGLKGGVLSFVVGFISSLLGIGGGILHVPGMVYLLGFPVHLAAGTSHFVLAFTAAAGTISHVAHGEFHSEYMRTAALACGAAVGAQLGARFSRAVKQQWIIRVLAVALAGVGLRVIFQAITH